MESLNRHANWNGQLLAIGNEQYGMSVQAFHTFYYLFDSRQIFRIFFPDIDIKSSLYVVFPEVRKSTKGCKNTLYHGAGNSWKKYLFEKLESEI